VWDEEIRLARLAADLGFGCLWSAEHHFNDYSFVPDNLQLMTYLTAVIRKNRIRVYFRVIERAPYVEMARCQPANSPWTRWLKEGTIGEDHYCYLKLLRSSWCACIPSFTTLVR
jgi:hypothetical protein